MDILRWGLLGVIWAVTVVPGVPALSHGWVLPWLRQRIRSPRLLGLSDLMVGLAGTVAVISAGWHVHAVHAQAAHAGEILSMCLGFCGFGMSLMARRVSWGPASSRQPRQDAPDGASSSRS